MIHKKGVTKEGGSFLLFSFEMEDIWGGGVFEDSSFSLDDLPESSFFDDSSSLSNTPLFNNTSVEPLEDDPFVSSHFFSSVTPSLFENFSNLDKENSLPTASPSSFLTSFPSSPSFLDQQMAPCSPPHIKKEETVTPTPSFPPLYSGESSYSCEFYTDKYSDCHPCLWLPSGNQSKLLWDKNRNFQTGILIKDKSGKLCFPSTILEVTVWNENGQKVPLNRQVKENLNPSKELIFQFVVRLVGEESPVTLMFVLEFLDADGEPQPMAFGTKPPSGWFCSKEQFSTLPYFCFDSHKDLDDYKEKLLSILNPNSPVSDEKLPVPFGIYFTLLFCGAEKEKNFILRIRNQNGPTKKKQQIPLKLLTRITSKKQKQGLKVLRQSRNSDFKKGILSFRETKPSPVVKREENQKRILGCKKPVFKRERESSRISSPSLFSPF